MPDGSSIPDAPVHILSALIVLALDWIWTFFEGFVTLSLFGILAMPILALTIATITFMTVYSIEYFVGQESGGRAFAKAAAMSVLAAVPYPVVGTIIGVPLLAWAGIKQLAPPR